MRERPILFTGPLVREILAQRKTITRRPVKPPLAPGWHSPWWSGTETATGRQVWTWNDGPELRRIGIGHGLNAEDRTCPYGSPGDVLWVRETWAPVGPAVPDGLVRYRADYEGGACCDVARWRPGIHMPRWACRLVLVIQDIRVERLQAITEEEARAEGVADRAAFASKWDEIYGAGEWDRSPWVWAITFRRITP